jgi:hypothetical protein
MKYLLAVFQMRLPGTPKDIKMANVRPDSVFFGGIFTET